MKFRKITLFYFQKEKWYKAGNWCQLVLLAKNMKSPEKLKREKRTNSFIIRQRRTPVTQSPFFCLHSSIFFSQAFLNLIWPEPSTRAQTALPLMQVLEQAGGKQSMSINPTNNHNHKSTDHYSSEQSRRTSFSFHPLPLGCHQFGTHR
jgi:hypothetical protein